jgi:hypothetical protein
MSNLPNQPCPASQMDEKITVQQFENSCFLQGRAKGVIYQSFLKIWMIFMP